jgi:hypothetical protein
MSQDMDNTKLLTQVAEALLAVAQELSRPKRIVRGPDGRPSHVETVKDNG